jgi:hypothetical protein
MGKCSYCGQSAGVLRRAHKECRELHDAAYQQVQDVIISAAEVDRPAPRLFDNAVRVGKQGRLRKPTFVDASTKGLAPLIDKFLDDGVLTTDEESKVAELMETFQSVLDEAAIRPSRERLVKAAILRDLEDEVYKQRIVIDGHLPLLTGKDDPIIWVFQGVRYYEQKTRTQYVGGSQGASFRIMKGVYYRVGAYKGERVQTSSLEHTDTGTLVISRKHLHFLGGAKSFRIQMRKLVSVRPYEDGIEVFKEAAHPKPQIFGVDDPWFASNALARLVV